MLLSLCINTNKSQVVNFIMMNGDKECLGELRACEIAVKVKEIVFVATLIEDVLVLIG